MNGICSAWDCVGEMIGFTIIGVVVGVGGAYLLSRYGKRRELPMPRPEESPAAAGLGRRYRRQLRSGFGCGCGR